MIIVKIERRDELTGITKRLGHMRLDEVSAKGERRRFSTAPRAAKTYEVPATRPETYRPLVKGRIDEFSCKKNVWELIAAAVAACYPKKEGTP